VTNVRVTESAVLLSLLLCGACGSRQPAARLAAVKSDVQSFMRSVAENITLRGPAAWQDYFENSPSFFMAADGRLQFSDGGAARAAIPNLFRTIMKIELRWGVGLRVDPLTDDLAVIAVPWHETMTLADGNRLDVSGFFTAVAESRNGRWQFRNAHWSTVQPAGSAK
jgi:hypothetical protein